jgi:hypothetical protein
VTAPTVGEVTAAPASARRFSVPVVGGPV